MRLQVSSFVFAFIFIFFTNAQNTVTISVNYTSGPLPDFTSDVVCTANDPNGAFSIYGLVEGKLIK
jgi:hypothetical protein